MFGFAFGKTCLVQPVIPLFEGVEGTVAHPMGPHGAKMEFQAMQGEKNTLHCANMITALRATGTCSLRRTLESYLYTEVSNFIFSAAFVSSKMERSYTCV